MSGGCKCRLPAEGELTALPRKIPGSEGPLQGGGKRGGREEREGFWTGKTGETHRRPEINLRC